MRRLSNVATDSKEFTAPAVQIPTIHLAFCVLEVPLVINENTDIITVNKNNKAAT